MQDLYYSKFEKKSWRWWKTDHAQPDVLQFLGTISPYIKVYQPAKYLFSLFLDDKLVLYSHREQVDRDEVGRSFSFRHFQLLGSSETAGKRFAALVQEFTEPVHYSNPELKNSAANALSPASTASAQKIFLAVWQSMLADGKVCILNKHTNVPGFSKTDVDHFTFLNFPGSPEFIGALNLLPPALLREQSFLLNYENDMVSGESGPLANIRIIFCYRETVTDPGNIGDKTIDESKLKREGYNIVYPGELQVTQDQSAFHAYMQKRFWSDEQDMERSACLLLLNNHSFNSLSQKARFVYFTFKVAEKISREEADFEFIDIYFNVPELADDVNKSIREFRTTILSWLLSEIPASLFYAHFYKIVSYVKRDNSFAGDLHSISQQRPASLSGLVQIINDEKFNGLDSAVKQNLRQHFNDFSISWPAFKSPAVQHAVRQLKKEKLAPANLGGLWKQLDGSVVYEDDIEAIRLLHAITRDNEAFGVFLSRRYADTLQTEWLDEAKGHKVQLSCTESDFNAKSLQQQMLFLKHHHQYAGLFTGISKVNTIVGQVETGISGIAAFDDLMDAYNLVDEGMGEKTGRRLEKVIGLSMAHSLKHEVDSGSALEGLLQHLESDPAKKMAFAMLYNSHVFNSIVHLYKDNPVTVDQLLTLGKLTAFNEKDSFRHTRDLFRALDATVLLDQDTVKKNGRNIVKFVHDIQWKRNLPPRINGIVKDQNRMLGSIKKNLNRILLIAALVVTAVTVFLVVYKAPPQVSRDNGDTAKTTTTVIENLPIDSTAVAVKMSEQLLNQVFFKNDSGINYIELIKIRSSIDFIKFRFPEPNFRRSIIRKLDTIPGNFWWNRFVMLNKDTIRYRVAFFNTRDTARSAIYPDTLILVK